MDGHEENVERLDDVERRHLVGANPLLTTVVDKPESLQQVIDISEYKVAW